MSDKYPAWWEKLVKEHKTEGLRAGDLVAVELHLFKRYMEHLSRFVVHDDSTKKLVFLTGLSAYTKNPINLFLRGESSIGKSHNVTQTLQYFPEEDTFMLGGLSPPQLCMIMACLSTATETLLTLVSNPANKSLGKLKMKARRLCTAC